MNSIAKNICLILCLLALGHSVKGIGAEAPSVCSKVQSVITVEDGALVALTGDIHYTYVKGAASASLLSLAKIHDQEICLIGIWSDNGKKMAASVRL